MKQNFEKIENWLKENAHRIADLSLQKSASESALNHLENTIGTKIPDDFKQLYFWHNGLTDNENIGSLFYGMDILSVERIISDYQNRKENNFSESFSLQKADKEINSFNMYNLGWVKFASDSSHTGLYLDLAPSEEGNYGQIIFIDDEYEVGIIVADSTAELVANLSNDLQNNLYYLDEDALEDGNHYLITDSKIDIINWETSEVWKR